MKQQTGIWHEYGAQGRDHHVPSKRLLGYNYKHLVAGLGAERLRAELGVGGRNARARINALPSGVDAGAPLMQGRGHRGHGCEDPELHS